MKKKVAFICVHNAYHSQMAEAIARHHASDIFEYYSTGTQTKTEINSDAIRIIKHLYDIDMLQSQHPKLISQIPSPNIVITMGCNIQCPFIPCEYQEDWMLEDPSGKKEKDFLRVISQIEEKLHNLVKKYHSH